MDFTSFPLPCNWFEEEGSSSVRDGWDIVTRACCDPVDGTVTSVCYDPVEGVELTHPDTRTIIIKILKKIFHILSFYHTLGNELFLNFPHLFPIDMSQAKKFRRV